MTVDPFEREQARDAALWTGAALFVAALHVSLAMAYLLLNPAPAGQAEAPVFDVAFMPATSAPAPPAPEALPAEPTPPVEHADLAPPQVEKAPPPEPAPPAVALQAPEPAQPDQVTVMPPPAKPAEPVPRAKPEKVPERSAHKSAAHEKAEKDKHKMVPPKPAAAPGSKPAQLAMAPNSGADSEGARAGRASWESELAAHIRRYATYAANGSRESGTVRVGVTIDRNGRLLSRRLAGSSGSSMLDNAAMAVIERAQPYPRFPPGMTQAQIALTIPLHLRPQ
jgi:periplasmic protein TonB